MYSKKSSSYHYDVLLLLNELMCSPRGCLSFQQLQVTLASRIDTDMRRLCLHGMLSNYIEFKSTTIQLTDRGMEHFLQAQNQLSVFEQCS
ncbi:hypothetical protein VspSTUT11_45680 [Vibrio sp. STUT-A11]|nr:hypothetical protein VspSTUT11_45680 [Vibrio sp. STUT-A11]